MGVGLSTFLYFLLKVSILLSLSSSPSGIEESTHFGAICVIGLVGGVILRQAWSQLGVYLRMYPQDLVEGQYHKML